MLSLLMNHFIIRAFLGGGFEYMCYFHPYLGKWSNLTNIFSDGLKPPTRYSYVCTLYILMIFNVYTIMIDAVFYMYIYSYKLLKKNTTPFTWSFSPNNHEFHREKKKTPWHFRGGSHSTVVWYVGEWPGAACFNCENELKWSWLVNLSTPNKGLTRPY